jgi:hypothetical protein
MGTPRFVDHEVDHEMEKPSGNLGPDGQPCEAVYHPNAAANSKEGAGTRFWFF